MGDNKLLFRNREELIAEKKEAIEVLNMLIESPSKETTNEELKEWQEQINKLNVEIATISNKIYINDLKTEITDKQFVRLKEKPFYYGKHNSRNSIYEKEIAISENYYLSNAIKVRLDFTYYTMYEGDNEIPRHSYGTDYRRFFIIDTNGEVERDDSEQDKNEVYLRIDFTIPKTT